MCIVYEYWYHVTIPGREWGSGCRDANQGGGNKTFFLIPGQREEICGENLSPCSCHAGDILLRIVTYCYILLHTVTYGYIRYILLHIITITYCYILIHILTHYYILLHIVTYCYKLLHTATYCYITYWSGYQSLIVP